MNSRTVIIAGLALALAGCSLSSRSGMVEDTHFGEAKNMTMQAQIIDPDPQYEYLDPPTSGQKAAAAVDRYRKDGVKQPERVSSTSGSSGK